MNKDDATTLVGLAIFAGIGLKVLGWLGVCTTSIAAIFQDDPIVRTHLLLATIIILLILKD